MRKTFCLVCLLSILSVQSKCFASIIAGTSLTSPPPYMPGSFWGMTANVDRAFPFTPVAGGPYQIDALDVVLFHYQQFTSTTASFSINLDASGHPGASLGSFNIAGIAITPQVLTAQPLAPFTLDSGATYWLVGNASPSQLNWNLSSNAHGPAAYRVSQGDWVNLNSVDVSTFMIHGSPVPEPATFALAASGLLWFLSRRRITSSTSLTRPN